MIKILNEKVKLIITFILTLLAIFYIKNSLIAILVILPIWYLGFYPIDKKDVILFLLASFFFTIMDLVVVSRGIFTFTQKDFYIIPYYEIFLWGFYFVFVKKFINEKNTISINKKVILLSLIFMVCFSTIQNSLNLFLATTIFLIIAIYYYHEKHDFIYMGLFLLIGLIIELFGTISGLWYYPTPEFYIIPYWFIDLWCVMGLVLRRFILPVLNAID